MRRFVFAVGSSGGKPLEATKKDAASFYTRLISNSVGECHQESPPPLLGCTSVDDFNRELNLLLRNWNKEDQLVFYYSGHGEMRKNKYCLVLGNTHVDLLSFDSFTEHLELSGVEKAIIVLDACAAGQATKGNSEVVIDSSLNPANTLPDGMAIIASSGPVQFSWQNAEGDASIFTEVLLKILTEGIDNKEKFLFIDDVVEHVSETIKSDIRYTEYQQSPVFSVRGSQKIWLAHNVAYSEKSDATEIKPDVYSSTDLELLAIDKLSEEHPSKAESIDELDWNLVSKYRDAFDGLDSSSSKLPATKSDLQRLGLLSPVSVKTLWLPHRSAALCFCKRPDRFHPESLTIYIDMSNPNGTFIRKEILGPLANQLASIQDLITSKFNVYSYIDIDGVRQERAEVDFELFREILANAFVHRDFSVTGNVEIRLMEDRIEISNPGSLLAGSEFIEVLENTFRSIPRNPVLMLLMNRLRRTEQIGRGFELIRQCMKINGESSIQCFESRGPITVFRIPRKKQTAVEAREVELFEKAAKQAISPVTSQTIERQARPGESYEEARKRLESAHEVLIGMGIEPDNAQYYIDNQGEEAVLRCVAILRQRPPSKHPLEEVDSLIKLLDSEAQKQTIEEQKNIEQEKVRRVQEYKENIIRKQKEWRSLSLKKIRAEFLQSLSKEQQESLLNQISLDLGTRLKSLESPLASLEVDKCIDKFDEKLQKELNKKYWLYEIFQTSTSKK